MTDEFLTGGESLPAVKFTAIGDTVEGQVTAVRKRIDTAPDGTPKTWSNGDPMHVFVFDLTGATGCAPAPECSLWVRGNMVKTLRDAARDAKVTTMEGARIKVRYDADGEAKRGFSPPKLFRAKVDPGVLAPTHDDLAPF